MTDADKAFLVVAVALRDAHCMVSSEGGQTHVVLYEGIRAAPLLDWRGPREHIVDGVLSSAHKWLQFYSVWSEKKKADAVRKVVTALLPYDGCRSPEELLLKAEVLA